MTVLANISGAAADLLDEARIMDHLGVELGGIWDTDVARELEAEELGAVVRECEAHGAHCPPGDDCSGNTYDVFKIGQGGVNWLVNSGRVID